MSSTEDPEAVVRRTAALARLSIDDAEVARLARDFQRTLEAFHALGELDLEGAPGIERAGLDDAPARPDEVVPPLGPTRLLAAAPDREDDFFRVPKTVGGPE